jgi:NAD(P)H-dependent flavin oxidoreductase YrpB (nitropropane dioxygenase family)
MQRFDLASVPRRPGVMWGSLAKEQVAVVLEERVPLLAAALGDPAGVVAQAHAVGTRVLGMAGSVLNALRQKQAGVDIIVSQGAEAGGHTGRISTFPLLPAVVDATAPSPVVAAGGIADGRGVVAALALGAVGAWIGTAFLAAEEAAVPQAHWNQLQAGKAEDFTVSRVYTGKTARSFANEVKRAWDESGLAPLPMPLQSVLMKPFEDAAIAAGRWELVVNNAGQVGGSLREKRPAREILQDIVSQASELLRELPGRALARA